MKKMVHSSQIFISHQEGQIVEAILVASHKPDDINIVTVLGDFYCFMKWYKKEPGYEQYSAYSSHIFIGLDNNEYPDKFSLESAFWNLKNFLPRYVSDIDLTTCSEEKAWLEKLTSASITPAGKVLPRDSKKKYKNAKYSYRSRNIQGMVAAILHYYLINDYNIIKCAHCGRYFATQTLKRKYCPRKSPLLGEFSGGKNNNCEQTMRNSTQQIKRKIAKIHEKIEENPLYLTISVSKDSIPHKQLAVFQSEFIKNCDKYWEAVKKEPTCENIKLFNDYIEKELRAKRWEV